jgi:septin family protein
MQHPFIFTPGMWEGEGTITFGMAENILDFKMNRTVLPLEDEKVYFSQIIDIDGFADKMRNNFCISTITHPRNLKSS